MLFAIGVAVRRMIPSDIPRSKSAVAGQLNIDQTYPAPRNEVISQPSGIRSRARDGG